MVFYFLILVSILSCTALKEGITLRYDRHKKSKPLEKVENISQKKEAKKNKELENTCYNTLSILPGRESVQDLRQACAKVSVREGCRSYQERALFHYERQGSGHSGLKILAIGLIHGDEIPSGSVARSWMVRLEKINPRSTWRIIPVANPDGLEAKTRTNTRGVDINRNFPTQNWEKLAIKLWKERYKSTWRKYPGSAPGSERETRCLVGHIQDFNPDFIVSLHTPLGHLDFDGPKMIEHSNYNLLPWRRFGHFPGSLGRYMWRDHGVPVLTIELKNNYVLPGLKALDLLQDISGSVAIKAKKILKKTKPN